MRIRMKSKIRKEVPPNTPCGYCFERWATCWDHLLPYSYSWDNSLDNLYPSCSRCNSLLSDKVFDTIDEKRDYIRKKLKNMERPYKSKEGSRLTWNNK